MKKIKIAVFIFNCLILSSKAGDNDIRLNSLGFLPQSPKKATVIAKCDSFKVINLADSLTIYSGKVTGPFNQADVAQEAWIVDFSGLETIGDYYIEIPEVGKSIKFRIGDEVYNDAFFTAFRGLYLWRCGTDVEIEYKGNTFQQDSCHLNDGFMDYVGQPGIIKDGTKGWHDAGDYGKYVVNAGVSVGMLFSAWDHYNDKLKDLSFDIPETAPQFPDFLEEMKWETDWLLSMQYPDGSGRVSHKLTRLNFEPFVMPQDDPEKRYYSEWGSTATADFVAMISMAARYFKAYDTVYAQKCLDAARLSYSFLEKNPEFKEFEQGDFKTGSYQAPDWDDRLWAAAEMWETTGDDKYLTDFESRVSKLQCKSFSNWDWDQVANLGIFTYLMSDKAGKNTAVIELITTDLIKVTDSIVMNAQDDIYGRPLRRKYYWGCNGTVVRQVMNLHVAYQLTGDEKYKKTALEAIGHVFGRNYYNRSYVTGIGSNPPMHPHDRRSGADNVVDPWPGYIVGGGHTATDWVDVQESYSRNEIALNWQAALIYAMAWFINL